MMDGRKEEGGKWKEGVALRQWLRMLPLLLAALLVAVPLGAQAEAVRTTQSEEVARRAIGLLRSPYCPGLMLEVCPSEPAEALRDSIRMLAAEGRSSDDLVEWMIAGHGEEWRAVPKRQGAGLWAWLLPPMALLVGAGVVTVRLRAMRGAAAANPDPASAELSLEEHAQIASALQELEQMEEEAR
jgi:cytochrome c-type biogenesis protein CcmH